MTGLRSWKIPTGRRWTKSRNSQNYSAHRQLFALTARGAEKENLQLARIGIRFTNHLALETAAFEAGHREPPERAVSPAFGVADNLPGVETSVRHSCQHFTPMLGQRLSKPFHSLGNEHAIR